IAGNALAHARVAETRLHLVGDQRLDGDYLAALGSGRHVDESASHQIMSSRQAPSVMTTPTLPVQNEPSDIAATATTVWVSESRMRVEMVARPARGPSLALITLGCGFFSLKIWMAVT